MGEYQLSVTADKSALVLLGEDDEFKTFRQKTYLRLAKSQIHLCQYELAGKARPHRGG